jgi:hypothetical protein
MGAGGIGQSGGGRGVSDTTDDMTLKRIRIEMPSGMAAKLDVQAKKRGVTRQELIKVWAWGSVGEGSLPSSKLVHLVNWHRN